jgi:hypothetical protein
MRSTSLGLNKSILNKQMLRFEGMEFQKRGKNTPNKVTKEHLAIFKNKINARGNYKLVIQ